MQNLPPEMTVRSARDRYLNENGFSADTYTDPTFGIDALGRTWTFRNPPVRQRAIPIHDLHHVVTGYGTDFIGEAEIGAWELVGGCTSFFLYYINVTAVLGGLVISPRRVIRAAKRARGQRTLYREGLSADDVLGMTLGELRSRLGVPQDGQADEPAGLNASEAKRRRETGEGATATREGVTPA